MKKWIKDLLTMAAVAVVMLGMCALGRETKYSTSAGLTSPAVTFAATPGQQVVAAVDASCDYPLGAVTFYTCASGRYAVTGTNSTTVVTLTNTAVTNGDVVVYQYADGTAVQTTCSTSSPTAVCLTTGLTAAWSAGDRLYEMAAAGKIVAAGNSATNGTNVLLGRSGNLFIVPAGSPLYVTLDSRANTCLQVTVE